MVDFAALADSVIKGNAGLAKQLTEQAVSEGVDGREIMNSGLIAGMEVVGRKFKANEFYLPEVLVAARAMHAGLDVVKPLLEEGGAEPVGHVIIGTVKGDLHDIGKNIVAMMLTGAGFEVEDLGADVPAERFIESVKRHKRCVVGMSALLTTTMLNMREVIVALNEAGLGDKVRTIVGGAPVSESFAAEIAAGDYAQDAATAVEKVRALFEELK